MSVLNDELISYFKLKMNLNALSQLLTTFIIVSIGPACIAYLAYKKAL